MSSSGGDASVDGVGDSAPPLRVDCCTELSDAVIGLLEGSFLNLTDDEVIEALREVETCARQLVVVSRRLTIEAAERKLPKTTGADTVRRFLIETLRLSSADAGARAKAAEELGTWHDLQGEPKPVTLALAAAAQAEGDISPDHVRAIEKAMDRLPDRCSATDREAAQDQLVTYARTGWPDDVVKVGNRILAHLDPDGTLIEEKDQQRMRGIVLGRQRADGMRGIKGELTPEFCALLEPVLAKFARPGMCNPDDAESPTAANTSIDPDQLRMAAGRDLRSAAQRTHDALLTLLQPGVTPDGLGTHRGLPVATILTMTINQVEEAAGVATTATGGTVPLTTALRLAERSRPYLAVFDHAGMPLHLGRDKRLATLAQRLALIASIRGCSRPGCDAPASLSAVHHVTEWSKDGPTDVSNETLACDHCHGLVHDGPGGWKTIVLGQDSAYPGRTGWIAPRHIDPTRTARVNHRHHPGELLAQTVARITVRKEREAAEYRKRLRRHVTHDREPAGLTPAE
ncbi:HNH endonuclease [Nocardia sp. NBC_01503]|uniref:HNH endonuclease signature motif containing protein n=1 Tax=Nocardia sp. NBC_01503 TaxID=2975997 RepID=UPI002E7AD163|nr:DUF222 domain-containing protein [Nocardia sp. NBC_01503]WTL29695.1 HNH endonuclease [Nocardia sp. NBC_01503]